MQTLNSLVPIPARATLTPGAPFTLAAGAAVTAPPEALPIAARLVELVSQLCGLKLAAPAPASAAPIVLSLSPNLPGLPSGWQGEEAYRLEVSAGGIKLSARALHGLANGAATLAQLITTRGANGQVPLGVIEDFPRFRWRGLMLDSSRHLFDTKQICRLLDLMALHKLNRFHWHLTDDQGWRLPVGKYPRLAEVGAWRAQSPKMGDAQSGDGQPYGGFYTKEDIAQVVAHAASRFIEVVPEIEMPGHSTAAIAAYPWLGNEDIPDWKAPAVADCWGVHHMTLTPKETTFRFIEEMLDEVLPLFPGQYVHIGGDEAPKEQWQKSPAAQEVIRREGLKDEHELQAWFIRRVEKMLTARGKRLIGWDEIQEGGLSPTASMMVWRDWKWATLALQRGNDIVMSPTTHTYFDYRQGEHPDTPQYQTIGQGTSHHRTLEVEKVSALEPIPPATPVAQHRQVLGCQGQLWTEYIWSYDKLEYMAFPRACALAEVGWSSAKARSASPFMNRLSQHEERLQRLGVNYRRRDGLPARADANMSREPHHR